MFCAPTVTRLRIVLDREATPKPDEMLAETDSSVLKASETSLPCRYFVGRCEDQLWTSVPDAHVGPSSTSMDLVAIYKGIY